MVRCSLHLFRPAGYLRANNYFKLGPSISRGKPLINSELASEHCAPCEGVKPFTAEEAREALKALPGWTLRDGAMEKEFRFQSYLAGLDFADSIGKIAESENHHPDLIIGWRRVRVMWSTHAIKGLSRNDLIMASKTELEFSRSVAR
jgi:4a-hydroxytetrahydrobiopterin dehydratase